MLDFKPHTVTVRPVTQTTSGTRPTAQNPKLGDPTTVQGYLEPGKASEAFRLLSVGLNSPAMLYIEIADAGFFPVQAQVTLGMAKYSVVAEPQIYATGDETAHAVVLLEGLQYPQST